jgi:hypothetical protein
MTISAIPKTTLLRVYRKRIRSAFTGFTTNAAILRQLPGGAKHHDAGRKNFHFPL